MALCNTLTLNKVKNYIIYINKSSTNTVQANDKNYRSNVSLKRY